MRATARWRKLVRARRAETERISPGRGAGSAGYWNAARARRFAAHAGTAGPDDPFLRRLRAHVDHRSTVLDVGAGVGRFALALAPRVERVTAVDASADMLAVLRRQARRLGVENVEPVLGRWEDVDALPADVVICSYVLPLVEDAGPFLARVDAAARERAFVYLNAAPSDLLVDAFWRHFHGAPRRLGPTYLDAVAVLDELGISPEVEVVEVPSASRFATLGAAVRSYADTLLLPDTREAHRELRRLLSSWLVEDGGMLRAPVATTAAAVLTWRPRRRRREQDGPRRRREQDGSRRP